MNMEKSWEMGNWVIGKLGKRKREMVNGKSEMANGKLNL
jgi:hypothetical protein